MTGRGINTAAITPPIAAEVDSPSTNKAWLLPNTCPCSSDLTCSDSQVVHTGKAITVGMTATPNVNQIQLKCVGKTIMITKAPPVNNKPAKRFFVGNIFDNLPKRNKFEMKHTRDTKEISSEYECNEGSHSSTT